MFPLTYLDDFSILVYTACIFQVQRVNPSQTVADRSVTITMT